MTGGGASVAAKILLGVGGLFLLLGNATYVPAESPEDVSDNATQWVLSRLFLAVAAIGLGAAGALLAAAAAPTLGTTGRVGGALLAVGSPPLLTGELILAVAATRAAVDGDAAFTALHAAGGALQEMIAFVYAGAAVVAAGFTLHAQRKGRRISHGIASIAFAIGAIGYPLFWVAPEVVGIVMAVAVPAVGFVWAIVIGVHAIVRGEASGDPA